MVIETNAKLLSTTEAAEALGISRRQVRTLIERGQLPAEKQGRDWWIRASDLRLVKVRPKGRPEGAKDSKPRKRKASEDTTVGSEQTSEDDGAEPKLESEVESEPAAE